MTIGYENARRADRTLDEEREKARQEIEDAGRQAGRWKSSYEDAMKQVRVLEHRLRKLELAGDELHYDASDFAEQSRDLTNSLALWGAIREKDR